MALDPTIALSQPPSFDTALKPLSSMLAIQGQLQDQQTRQLQQNQLQTQLQERENLSKIDWNQFRSPDGSFDNIGAGNAAMQAAPAFFGPQLSKQFNEMAKDAITIKQGAQNLNQSQRESLGSVLGALSQKQDVSRNDIYDGMSQYVDQNPSVAPLVMTTLKHMPPTDDPKALQSWLQIGRNGVLKPSEQGNDVITANSGGQTNLVSYNKFSNSTPQVVGTLDNTLSPSEASEMTQVTNPDGSVKLVPKATILQQAGLGQLLPPQVRTQQSPQPGPQLGAGGPPDGRYPNSGFQISPPAGVVDATKKVNATSGDMLAADLKANSESGNRVLMLQKAAQGLNGADSGQNSETLQNLRGTLVTLGLATPGQAATVQSYDEANKYLTQYAQQKAASFGNGTDAQLSAAITGNGNTHISNLAAKDVVKVNMALERMDQARMKIWDSTGLPASQYAQWKSRFGSTMDPRVFVTDQMDRDASQAMVNKMSPNEQKTFRAQYNWAVQNGIINRPQ